MPEFAPQQLAAIDAVGAWLASSEQVFYLAGYAGTGKTTIAKHLASLQDGNVAFAAYTGKAASVLRRKGCDASTIHSLIYKVVQPDGLKIRKLQDALKKAESVEVEADLKKQLRMENSPRFVLNDESILLDTDLVIIDECSMVGESIGKDLLSFGTKILVLGDPGQLPPVDGGGFFTSRTPNFLLTEIHRQARDNPIINMATIVRQGGTLKPGAYGGSKVLRRNEADESLYLSHDQIIVGANRTRKSVNLTYRDLKSYDGALPEAGEKVICLKNNAELGILNGTQWRVESCEDKGTYLDLEVTDWDAPGGKPVKCAAHHFNVDFKSMMWYDRKRAEEFDFGYAITCHKSQGSQWPNVFIHNEAFMFRDSAKQWLYTALTRAESNVTVKL